MKTILLILISLLISNSFYSQDVYAMIGKGVAKKNFKATLENLEEKTDRSFYKTGKTEYFGSDIGNDDFKYFDNNIYADCSLNNDVLNVTLFKYNSSKKAYEVCGWYHGRDSENYRNTKYKHLDGDVYVVEDELNKIWDECTYVLYNKSKGLYYHSCIRDTEYGKKTGGGIYKKSKAESIAAEDLKIEENNFAAYNDMFKKAVASYINKQKQLAIKKIMDSPDEGVTNTFHKQNIGKLLFGNNVTEQNKFNATSYKTKFTLDEGIKVGLFLNQGLNKYIDTNERHVKENIVDLLNSKTSKFKIKLTLENGKSKTTSVYIENPTPHTKTSGVFDLVLKNATQGNNHWIKDFLPETIDTKELKVTVELFTESNPNTVLASGNLTYSPKIGAKVPYGYSCSLSKDVSSNELAKLKPRLKEIAAYGIGRYNKKENRAYSFVNLSISSDWRESITEYGTKDIFFYVEVLCKDSKGNLFSFNDRFMSLDKSDIGYFELISSSKFNVNYCDK